MSRITITKPDDWHIHLRDGDMLERTVNDVAAWANRAVVMPNLSPPVKNITDATAYHNRIMAAFYIVSFLNFSIERYNKKPYFVINPFFGGLPGWTVVYERI